MHTLILGAGVTGLAAGLASGFPIFEATDIPGGLCSSYYLRPGQRTRLNSLPQDRDAYRFELGGGHWIFGGDSAISHVIRSLTPVKRYERQSAVFFQEQDCFVPYPLQNHLRYLPAETAVRALTEMMQSAPTGRTMGDWLELTFGPTLCRLFFYPFHDLYTAGLYTQIAPQDVYKSPIDQRSVIQGAVHDAPPAGYNATFAYPVEGLDRLAQRMAAKCDIHYGKRVVRINPQQKEVSFSDGSSVTYHTLISTLPLNVMLALTEIDVEDSPDPYTSVLVLNIGAFKGTRCPNEHWLYHSDCTSGFHRVGFYSNVDSSFLPASQEKRGERVSLYIERAYPGGGKPSEPDIAQYADSVVKELQELGFIQEVEALDSTWIDVAYTWSYPDSRWREQALHALERHDIYQAGRYGCWKFQGIADSIRDGLLLGASLKHSL